MSFSRPIVLVPGFLGGALSLQPMREELRNLGHAPRAWVRAPFLYRRRIAHYGQLLAEDAVRLREEAGHPLTVFGWSMGGLVSVAAMQALQEKTGNAHEIVKHVITFGTPFGGTWAAYLGEILDRTGFFQIREMRRRHPTLARLTDFLHQPRHWRFHAIHGDRDPLVGTKRHGLDPSWCRSGPYFHSAPLYHGHLYELIHSLMKEP